MFIRVRDKSTRHQFDVAEASFNPEKHEKIARFAPSKTARPAKPHVKTTKPKTSTNEVVEGVSPASE